MIIILCNSYEDAQDAYDVFISFLEDYDPWIIRKMWDSSNMVETEEDLRYLFVDYRFRSLFQNKGEIDIIDVDVFFEGIDYRYLSKWKKIYYERSM